MPLYEYRCDGCQRRFEVIQSFSDAPLDTCSECGGRLEKLISAPAVHFKGAGWYVTDYAKKSSTGSASSGSSSGSGDSSGDSSSAKGEGSSSSKSEGSSSSKSDGSSSSKGEGSSSSSSSSTPSSDKSGKKD